MKQKKENIGSLIRKIVTEKHISVTDFAEMIHCDRRNVYNIFDRNSIDIELLARISRVLDHNFFVDVARNYKLATPIEIDENEEEKRNAAYQFLDVMPKVMHNLGYDGQIILNKQENDEGLPMADYMITPHQILCTLGETYEQRLNGILGGGMVFTKLSDSFGNTVTLCNNIVHNYQYIDIKIEYKTEEEWSELFLFALSCAERYYSPHQKNNIWNLMNGYDELSDV